MTERVRVIQVVTRMTAGAGGVALRGALALDPDAFEVSFVAAPGGDLIAEAGRARMHVIELPSLRPELDPRSDLSALRALVEVFRRERPHVIHTHSAKAGALGRLAARRARVPAVVHTFHGFPFHEFQSPPRRAAYIAVERALARCTDEFLAVGTNVAAQAVRLRIAAPTRITTIAPAIDFLAPPRDRSSRARARQHMSVPTGMFVVGTVGRLDYQKDPETFLQAAARINRDDVVFVWIGDGPLAVSLPGLIAKYGLTDKFRMMGNRTDVPDLLPGLDVFALSSRYEGVPCAVAEAMSVGIPIAASAVNGVPELVHPGRTGLLVPPEDPQALAASIAWLLDNPIRAREMATEAREALGTRFRVDELGRDLTRTYLRILGFPLPEPVEIPYIINLTEATSA